MSTAWTKQFSTMIVGGKKVVGGLRRCAEAILEFSETPAGQAILDAVVEQLTQNHGAAETLGGDQRGRQERSKRCGAAIRFRDTLPGS